MACDVLDGWWTDAGTFDSLVRASDFVVKEPPQ
jgi:dTDP-glucose pyrophosphorylase